MNLYFHVYTNLISIHAPRMESDFSWIGLFRIILFSIHAPRMESDGGRIFL